MRLWLQLTTAVSFERGRYYMEYSTRTRGAFSYVNRWANRPRGIGLEIHAEST